MFAKICATILFQFCERYLQRFRHIYVDGASEATLALPALTCTGRYINVTNNAAMTALSLPNLTLIAGEPKACDENIDDPIQCAQCVDGVCVGEADNGYLYLADNTALTGFDMGSLESIGSYVYIAGNTLLPTTCGEGLLSQLEGYGFTGGFTNSGGAAGPCAP